MTVLWPGESAWWRHQMKTFSALLAICRNSLVTGELPAQRPVTRSFDVFFDLRLNKQLSKQWWGWWFETPLCPLWRHCNGVVRDILFSVSVLIYNHDSYMQPAMFGLSVQLGHFLLTWFSNYIHYEVWDEIAYPFLDFNGWTVEV